mmetsp:Transcript_5368/g.9156  ORF Transcript_5368/g.9156 Transcript_5368/m.9156 type:complete len:80 (-) Transcript_5368:109-348(-)
MIMAARRCPDIGEGRALEEKYRVAQAVISHCKEGSTKRKEEEETAVKTELALAVSNPTRKTDINMPYQLNSSECDRRFV